MTFLEKKKRGRKMEFVSESLNVNEKGHLTIGGVDTVYLKEKYGTPLYVMDEDLIRKNMGEYRDALKEYYGGNGMAHYASKAFSCKYIYKVAQEEGLGADVVSGGELYTALKAGFPPQNICFHGNNKTVDELKMAVENNVGHIIVDNETELFRLEEICKELNKKQEIIFRIKPGVDAHTHDFIKTGQIDSKFGFAIETNEAIEIVKKVKSLKNVIYKGIHCHIGSQIFELAPFIETADVMMNFIKEIKDKTGLETDILDFGGGFGIKYVEEDKPIKYAEFIKAVSEEVKKLSKDLGVKIPYILMEPGRSLVASAGITLYEVGCVKEIPNVRTYVSVDGGMGDNPRYILYGAKYCGCIANKADKEADKVYTIAGKCCESGDLIMENEKFQEAEVGDTLAVFATGAYNYSMASNYNRIPRPAVVFVRNGEDKLVVKRETYDDIISLDL